MSADLPPLEHLLHVLTARGALSWRDWKSACLSLSSRLSFHGLSESGAARLLDELAHIEIAAEIGHVRIMAAPAVLVRLPKAGVAIGIFSGGRSPQTVQRLAEAAQSRGGKLTIQPHSGNRLETPAVLRVEADDGRLLREIAIAAGIRTSDTPAAWMLAHAAGSVDRYISTLSWRHGPEPTFDGREFDPVNGRYIPIRRGTPGMRLIKYQPRAHPPFWELRMNEKAAPVERDWGIHACLCHHEREHLIYDRDMHALAVPAANPLPRPLARALALCSGEAPELIERPADWPSIQLDRYHVYREIPFSIADVVLNKIGQRGLPFHIPPKS